MWLIADLTRKLLSYVKDFCANISNPCPYDFVSSVCFLANLSGELNDLDHFTVRVCRIKVLLLTRLKF